MFTPRLATCMKPVPPRATMSARGAQLAHRSAPRVSLPAVTTWPELLSLQRACPEIRSAQRQVEGHDLQHGHGDRERGETEVFPVGAHLIVTEIPDVSSVARIVRQAIRRDSGHIQAARQRHACKREARATCQRNGDDACDQRRDHDGVIEVHVYAKPLIPQAHRGDRNAGFLEVFLELLEIRVHVRAA